MKTPKTVFEIILFLNLRVQELAFSNVFEFFIEILKDHVRLANDQEVSEILYDTIEYGGLFVPDDVPTETFTISSILKIADANYKPKYCKERLAKELNVHEQTINKWLQNFDEDLYQQLHKKRKLTFFNLYQIIFALGFNEHQTVLNRRELLTIGDIKSSDLKKELPEELSRIYQKFLKFPPIFSLQVLDFYGIPHTEINKRYLKNIEC